MVAAAATNTKTSANSSVASSEKKIGGFTESQLLNAAIKEVEKKTEHSTLLSTEAEARFPKFDLSEITCGNVLGRGGFCVVQEVTQITLNSKNDTTAVDSNRRPSRAKMHQSADEFYAEQEFIQDREFMAAHYIREISGKLNNNNSSLLFKKRSGKQQNYRYALKLLQTDTTTSTSSNTRIRTTSISKRETEEDEAQFFMKSVIDLAIEIRYLSVLRHPHIIKMRGMANAATLLQPGTTRFIVLDKLYDILSKRLKTNWKRRMGSTNNHRRSSSNSSSNSVMFWKKRDGKNSKAHEFWLERLSVAYDLSTALKYLHEDHHVIYRDLKPENIGFDIRGDVKLFDFGLAREIPHHEWKRQHSQPASSGNDRTYPLLTGDTGSPRYMAPEVALEQPYNETCDVYSFCILLWEILMVETPFEIYPTLSSLRKKVVELGVRPKPDPTWPPRLIDLMRNGWDADISKRPSFVRITNELRLVLRQESGDEDRSHSSFSASRRSFVMLRQSQEQTTTTTS